MCCKCEIIVNSTSPWLGASPEFLVSDTCEKDYLGVGEVKCLYSKRHAPKIRIIWIGRANHLDWQGELSGLSGQSKILNDRM